MQNVKTRVTGCKKGLFGLSGLPLSCSLFPEFQSQGFVDQTVGHGWWGTEIHKQSGSKWHLTNMGRILSLGRCKQYLPHSYKAPTTNNYTKIHPGEPVSLGACRSGARGYWQGVGSLKDQIVEQATGALALTRTMYASTRNSYHNVYKNYLELQYASKNQRKAI